MHHPANSMTELYWVKRSNVLQFLEKAILAVIGRSADLSVCKRVDEFGLPAIWCEIVC